MLTRHRAVELNVEQDAACASLKPKRRGLPYFHVCSQKKSDKEKDNIIREKIPETAGVGMSRGRRQVNEEAEKSKH